MDPLLLPRPKEFIELDRKDKENRDRESMDKAFEEHVKRLYEDFYRYMRSR